MFELVMQNVESVFETVFVTGQDNDEEVKEDVNVVVLALASKATLPPRLDIMVKIQSILRSATENQLANTARNN
jgi:hypothetical protein